MAKRLKLSGVVVSDDVAWIYDWFGYQTISPSAVHSFLEDAAGDDVEISINSGGGDVYVGAEIYTALRSYPGNSTSEIILAASAASVFAMGAKRVLMSPAGQMMIHNASTVSEGDKNAMTDTASMLKSVDESIANTYVAKTGMDRDKVLNLMNKETWMDAVKAKELGFIDDIMFENQVPQVAASAAGEGLIPSNVINYFQEARATGKAINMPPVNGGNGMPSPAPAVKEVAPPKNENKEDNKTMTLEELKQNHPELYNQIVEAAQASERTRIAGLQAMSKVPGAAPFIQDAITNGDTVDQMATKILMAQAAKLDTEAKNRAEDAMNSGVNNVQTEEPVKPEVTDAAKKEASIQHMINLIPGVAKGGRK